MRASSIVLLVFSLISSASLSQEIRLAYPEHGDQKIYKELLASWALSRGSFHSSEKNSSERNSNGDSSFDVKYNGFSPEAQAAFQYAVDIWDDLIKSDIKIKIFATWAVSANLNNLGSASPVESFNFQGAPIPDIWYPMPLAEKLKNEEINNAAEADIIANFNSGRTDWYFGIDGNCPPDKFDLVTVILHEIGHGLGISSTMRVGNNTGFFGASNGRPKIYDLFLLNSNSQILVKNFESGSLELAAQLQSNALTFDSPIAKDLANLSANPRIYAPNPYNGGSSISHLDQTTYSGTINDLMTPFASRGKVRHSIGPIIKGMLYNMGWLHTYMNHTPLTDKESLAGVSFDLTIFSDTVIRPQDTKLIISDDGFQSFSEIVIDQVTPTLFQAAVSGLNLERQIDYFFEIKDVLQRTYRLPIDGNYSFYLGQDQIPPAIQHSPLTSIISRQSEISFSGSMTDNLGISIGKLEYQLNDGIINQEILALGPDGAFSFTLNLNTLNLKEGDKLRYRLIATDNSLSGNTTVLPSNDFFTIDVKTFPVVETYVTDFNASNTDFFGDFVIKTELGFTSRAIHSPHPYLNDKEYKFELLVPIKVRSENALVSFDEVVLVEPGTSTNYLENGFKDFVIVEASLYNESLFIPLVQGYDSRERNNWLTYYNSQISSGNSVALGTLNYFIRRQIDIWDTFDPGDTIRIRFRLLSDNTSYGWGWAIDNLKIQDQVTSIIEVNSYEGVYPNPMIDRLHIRKVQQDEVQIRIVNATGQLYYANMQTEEENIVDVSNWPSGLYVLRIFANSEIRTYKLVKR